MAQKWAAEARTRPFEYGDIEYQMTIVTFRMVLDVSSALPKRTLSMLSTMSIMIMFVLSGQEFLPLLHHALETVLLLRSLGMALLGHPGRVGGTTCIADRRR